MPATDHRCCSSTGTPAPAPRGTPSLHGVVSCPTLLLWSEQDDLEELYGDPLAIWRPWCTELSGASIDSGHHMAEDNPEALSSALLEFLELTP